MSAVDAGSPAGRAGLRVADVIFKIDGDPVANVSEDELVAILHDSGKVRTFEVGRSQDSTRL